MTRLCRVDHQGGAACTLEIFHMLKRSLVASLPLLLTGLAIGCNTPSAPSAAPDTTATTSAAVTTPAASASAGPDGKRGRKREGSGEGRRHGGPQSPAARLVHEADELDLSDAQKATVEKLEKDLRPENPPGQADRKAIHEELIAGVKAGKIDAAKLDAKSAEAEKAMIAHREKELEVVNALHAALQPAQRKALTAAVRAKQAARDEHMDKGDKGPPKGDPTGFATRRAERLTKQLELDAAQQKKVEALVAKDRPEAPAPGAMEAMRDEAKKKLDAMLTAFEGDTFDAKKLDVAPPAPPKGAKSRMGRELAFLSELLPILKPEQREKLAASMQKRMDRPGPGGMGHAAGFFDD